MVLDLNKPAGREVLLKMLPHYDVFVENYGPGVIEKLDLAGYFLIVWDFVNWGRARGIPALARGCRIEDAVGASKMRKRASQTRGGGGQIGFPWPPARATRPALAGWQGSNGQRGRTAQL